MQQNQIKQIENLDSLELLDTLNLSNNYISKLENLSCCPLLSSLVITHNCLEFPDDLEHLIECKNLSSLDMSYNRITDVLALDIFGKMKILVNIQYFNFLTLIYDF